MSHIYQTDPNYSDNGERKMEVQLLLSGCRLEQKLYACCLSLIVDVYQSGSARALPAGGGCSPMRRKLELRPPAGTAHHSNHVVSPSEQQHPHPTPPV